MHCVPRAFPKQLQLHKHGCYRLYHELSFRATGNPLDVLEYHQTDKQQVPRKPSAITNPVVVAMRHAPWNPADMNSVQGRYPSPYPGKQVNRAGSLYVEGNTVAGSEGWGQVVEDESNTFEPGDWVTMGLSGYGTFRSHLVCDRDALIKVTRGQELMDAQGPRAVTLFQLGGTAYRMLQDFMEPCADDRPKIVIQNAGNSGVGFMASQLVSCLHQDAAMVSLVRRNRKSLEDMEELVDYLTVKGKNHLVVAEEELANKENLHALKHQLEETSNVCLALNAVGGESSELLLRCLSDGGTHVTYGGMSMMPVAVSTTQLIFKDYRLRGYWHSRWMVQNIHQRRKEAMINHMVDLVLNHDLVCPMVEVFGLSQCEDALKRASEQSISPVRRKLVFSCSDEDI